MAMDKRQRFEHVFDIAMTPVLAFDCRNRGDIARSERMHLRKYQEQHQQSGARVEEGHGGGVRLGVFCSLF